MFFPYNSFKYLAFEIEESNESFNEDQMLTIIIWLSLGTCQYELSSARMSQLFFYLIELAIAINLREPLTVFIIFADGNSEWLDKYFIVHISCSFYENVT